MNWPLLGALTGLALADSLNPFTVAAQGYLLGTPRPLGRSVAFLVGTFATYFLGGILLLQGWLAFFRHLAPRIPAGWIGAGEIILGLVLAGFAVWTFRRAGGGTPFRPPENLSVPATLAFAAASTVGDLPSALPYFAAVNRIAAGTDSLAAELLWLAWYNLLYVGPLILMIAAHAFLPSERSAALFGRIRGAIDWSFAKLLPPLMALGAAFLLYDGVRRWTGG